jgi:hypothetical protein
MRMVILGSLVWIANLIDLATGFSHMHFIRAVTCGTLALIVPIIVWRELPFALDGWKTQKSS